MVAQAARRVDGIGTGVPFHPLLFAAYPVLRLYGDNIAEVTTGEVVSPLLLVVGLTALGWAVLALVLRDLRRSAIATSAIVLPVMLFGLLLDVAAPVVGRDGRVALVAGVAAVAIAIFVAHRVSSRLGTLTLALNATSLVLVVLIAPAVMRGVFAVDAPDDRSPVTATVSGSVDGAARRDIYHIVLDRYGSERSLETGFGIDNAEFVSWLRTNGFQVIDDARANYVRTTLSLGATHGMALLDDIAQRMGPDAESYTPAARRVQRSRAGAFLQGLGYRYVHVGSWFNPTGESLIADRTYSPDDAVTFETTLYDTTLVPMLLDGPAGPRDSSRRHADVAEYEFDLLDALVESPGPTYVFAHILLPHPPYVFLSDGTYAPKRATFASQLAYTNARLRAFVEPLLALPEAERPIIILQGDEGPFPPRYRVDQDGFDWATATDEELVTKFGILNAMYLPGAQGTAPLPRGLTPVNTYAEVFGRYFGSDLPRHPDRTYASNRARPYDLLDVTERLDAIAARMPESDGGLDVSGRDSPLPG